MTIAQRHYEDSDGATQAVHMDNRSVGASAADVPIVRSVSGALDFGASSTGNVFNAVAPSAIGSAGERSSPIACDGYESLILHVEVSNSAAKSTIRPWLKDANGNYTPLAVVTVDVDGGQHTAALPTIKGSGFHCRLIEVPTYGAASIVFQLRSLSIGTLSVWAAPR